MFDIIKAGLEAQAAIVAANQSAKVVPIPTAKNIAALKAQGKRIVFKPTQPTDEPPKAA